MSGSTDPARRRPKATRINSDSVAFRWIVPAVLALLAIITVALIVAALAVIFGLIP